MKKIILMLIAGLITCTLILYGYLYIVQEEKVTVLGYHDIVNSQDELESNTVSITKEKFEEQIKWLSKMGYKSITMDDFLEWKNNKKTLPRKSVLITFDDGWESFYTNAIPILEKYNMKASVFVVWKWSEDSTKENNIYMTLEQIEEIKKNHPDMQILSHSYDLHNKESAQSNKYDVYNNDILKVKEFDNQIKYYAYPFGEFNEEYISALKDNNYHLAFTFGPYDFARKSDDNFKIPRLGIFESTEDWKFKLKMFLEM